jgi:hypothetical protein
MNVQGIDLLSNAKTLIPYELRPVEDKDSWGQSFLSTKEFFAVLGSAMISLGSGLFLYFSVSIYPAVHLYFDNLNSCSFMSPSF